MRRITLLFLMALALCLAPRAGTAAGQPRPESSLPSVDQDLAAVGREVPGFGGLYYDGLGRPNVFLLDPDRDGASAARLLGAGVVVHRAEYEFARLLAWRLALRPLLGLPGAVYLDADESSNRVVIGVAPDAGADREQMEREAVAAGVPLPAIVWRETPRAVPWTGLQSKIRPVSGGLQNVFSTYICTLGFNAYLGKAFGVVVAGHCTDTFGEVDGTRIYQPTSTGGDLIAKETVNPAFFSGSPCPRSNLCRYSDSAFAQYTNPGFGTLGRIARPTASGITSGPLTLSPASASFTIAGSAASILVGEVVQKVGRTTGWTYGPVIRTCADVNEGNVTLYCQTLVQIGGGPGDSGSPVFVQRPGNKARLAGLLWGGYDDPRLGVVGIYSPLANVEKDLGSLRIN